MDGFELLPVAFSSPSGRVSKHSIYCKKHMLREDSQLTPNARTLFSLGWPPYVTPSLIEDLFSRAGHVTAVYLQASPGSVDPDNDSQLSGFAVGYVVFASEKDADSAVNLAKKSVGDPILCPLPPECVGVRKWAWQYMQGRPSAASLERGAEVGVALYDRQQEAELKERKEGGVADEDGWIKVTRKTPKFVVSLIDCVWIVCKM